MTEQSPQASLPPRPRGRARRLVAPAAIGLAGLAAGAVLAGTTSASAADTTTPSASSTPSAPPARDQSRSQRPDEHLLSGATAAKVRAAALAKYPGATVQRVETDSDGVYEAHLVTASGSWVTVEIDKGFAVTGTEQAGPGGGPGGPGGPTGDRPGAGDQGQPSPQQQPSA